MNSYLYIGGNFDLPTKKILLYIEDEDIFLATLRVNTHMYKLGKEDLWRERMKKYYPKFLSYKDEIKLSWKEYFPIISLICKACYYNVNCRERELLPIHNLTVYLIHLNNFKFSNICNDKFISLFGPKYRRTEYHSEPNSCLYILTKICEIYFKYDAFTNVDFMNIRNVLDLSVDPEYYSQLILQHASVSLIVDELDSKHFVKFYTKNYNKSNGDKMIDIFNYFIPYFEDLDECEDIRENKFGFIISELIIESICNYHDKFADKLIQDYSEIDVSMILTNYIFEYFGYQDSNNLNMNMNRIVVYMISRKIAPRYNLLLPTIELVTSDFFTKSDSYKHCLRRACKYLVRYEYGYEDIPEYEIEYLCADKNIFRKLFFLYELYIHGDEQHYRQKYLIDICKLFSMAGFYPSVDVWRDLLNHDFCAELEFRD